MGFKDHEKISAADLEMLQPLLVEYYQKPYQEGYELLRKKIEARFRLKDTNNKYSPVLMADLDDLVLTVVLRLISINGKMLTRKAEKINDLELMANKIADLVYREELRALRLRLRDQPLDEDNSEHKAPPLAQQVHDEIRAIRKEIIKNCYDSCVAKLPAQIKSVFRAYYPDAALEPQELIAERKRLANEVAGITEAEARNRTPEQELRTLNNLQSKVNKWRKSLIEDCVTRCVAAQESRHSRLNYLNQQ
jgi:hypothetical protein